MLVRLGDIIYLIAAVCAALWLGVGIGVYSVDPDPPSEATFVPPMFIGAAVLICGGMVPPVRHFREEGHLWTLSLKKQQRRKISNSIPPASSGHFFTFLEQ